MKIYEKLFKHFRELGKELELPPGCVLWHQGDPGDYVALLLGGNLEVLHETPEGAEVVLRTLEQGDVVGELSAIDDLPRSAMVRASSLSTILRIPAPVFRDLLQSRPDLVQELFWVQVERVRSLTRKISHEHMPVISDPLTGLYNFPFFRERLGLELPRAQQLGEPVALVMFDIDFFRNYNERLGHDEGNRALTRIASIIRQRAGRGDIVARYGSQEIVALLYGWPRGNALKFAEDVRQSVEATPFAEGSGQPMGRVTISGGVAIFPEDASDESSLIEQAYRNLFKAKDRGRNMIFASNAEGATDLRLTRETILPQSFSGEPDDLGTIVRSAAAGIQSLTLSGEISFMNPAAADILGWTTEDLTGKLQHQFVHHSRPDGTAFPSSECPINEALQGGFTRQSNELFIRKDGRSVLIEYAISPLRRDGTLVGAVFIFVDITQRTALQDVLLRIRETAQDAHRVKSEFLATMSHELRTPLNAIVGYSQMLQDEFSDRGIEELIPDLEKITSAGVHLLDLVSDILDLTKIESDRMELTLQEVELSRLVEDVVAAAAEAVASNSNQLLVSCPEGIGDVHADPGKLRQIIGHLLNNAAKFTERGTITFEVIRQHVNGNDWVHFRVADSGIGMTQHQRSNLFQAFSQGDGSSTRKHGGIGLGLVLTRRLCQLMGGDVTVESEFGRGSVFTVKLPATVIDLKNDSPLIPIRQGEGGNQKPETRN